MKTVTFDTTTKPDDPVVTKALQGGWHVAFVTVSAREARGTDFEIALREHESVPEIAVWDEGLWDEMRWAGEQDANRLENILSVISSGSFPKVRDNLSEGQVHQLRDAVILEAHVAARREVFVTSDEKAFIRNGRREELQMLLNTRILTPSEFDSELA
jgi:hypothetical protein